MVLVDHGPVTKEQAPLPPTALDDDAVAADCGACSRCGVLLAQRSSAWLLETRGWSDISRLVELDADAPVRNADAETNVMPSMMRRLRQGSDSVAAHFEGDLQQLLGSAGLSTGTGSSKMPSYCLSEVLKCCYTL